MSELDPTTWRKLAPHFDEASRLSAAERTAYLERLHGEDPKLARHLEELLAADEQSSEFLESSAHEHAEALLGKRPARHQAPEIPGYRIDGELGHGGMGVVYVATRIGADFEQKVALKVVRPDLAFGEIQQRFARERRILAALEHPGIARLVDGGITPEGISYFAMEYVEGTPITSFADEQRLTVDERLRLFESICAAVDHAHQHFVVHRDLKPSNILVTQDGQPKLLDFGIARILESDEAEAGLTRETSRMMTPEYAAPEQLLGKPATAATDVYALGVILFELMCGHHPFSDSSKSALERAMSGEDSDWLPKALSRTTRIRRPDGSEDVVDQSSICEARRSSPRALRKRLGGDIASIVAMALRHEARDRYASPALLLEDLQSFRRGLPVRARRATWRYRIGKTVRRHRVGFAAAALVLLSITGGALVALWQARVASREATRAGQVRDFVVSLFADADPNQSLGTDWTAEQLLDRGAERLERELAEQPATRAELMATLGAIRIERGEYQTANRILRRALSVSDSLGQRDVASTRTILVPCANSETLLGNFSLAESLLTIAESRLGGGSSHPLARSELHSAYFYLYRRVGQWEEAEAHGRQALEHSRKAVGPRHPSVASDLDNLGVVMVHQGNYREATVLHQEALDIRRQAYGAIHPDIAVSLHNVANALAANGEHAAAIDLFEQSIAMKRELYPGAHPSLSETLRSLAQVYRAEERLDEADALVEESLEIDRQIYGPNSDAYGTVLNEMAIGAYLRNDLAKAKDLFEQALAVFAIALPKGHPTTITVANNLATVELTMGNLAAAEAQYGNILQLRKEVLGENHPDVGRTYNGIGLTVRQLGRLDEAIQNHRQALSIYQSHFDAKQPDVLRTQNYLASALSAAGQYEEAERLYRAVLPVYEAEFPPEHRDTADARVGYGQLLTRMGRPSEGLPYLEAGEAVRRKVFGQRARLTATAMSARGACLTKLGRHAEAESLLVLGHEVLLRELGDSHLDTKDAAANLVAWQAAQR